MYIYVDQVERKGERKNDEEEWKGKGVHIRSHISIARSKLNNIQQKEGNICVTIGSLSLSLPISPLFVHAELCFSS